MRKGDEIMVALGYLLALVYAALALLSGAIAYRFGLKKIYTRKIVHILVGAEWFILSYFHGNSVHFLIVCLFFLALLFLTMNIINHGRFNTAETEIIFVIF